VVFVPPRGFLFIAVVFGFFLVGARGSQHFGSKNEDAECADASGIEKLQTNNFRRSTLIVPIKKVT